MTVEPERTVRERSGRAPAVVDTDPDVLAEEGNRLALRTYIGSPHRSAITVVNALIEQRARHGWAIDDWMTMRWPDTGQIMTVDAQQRILDRVRRDQARPVAEHRHDQPDCPICREVG